MWWRRLQGIVTLADGEDVSNLIVGELFVDETTGIGDLIDAVEPVVRVDRVLTFRVGEPGKTTEVIVLITGFSSGGTYVGRINGRFELKGAVVTKVGANVGLADLACGGPGFDGMETTVDGCSSVVIGATSTNTNASPNPA